MVVECKLSVKSNKLSVKSNKLFVKSNKLSVKNNKNRGLLGVVHIHWSVCDAAC